MGVKRWVHAGLLAASMAVAATALAAPDPTPVDALLDQAVEALRTQPDRVFELTGQALAALQAQPDADREMRARILRCDYFNERDRDAARRELEHMQALLPRLRQPGLRAGMLSCEGEWHEQAGDKSRAMALYEQAVAVAESAGDQRRLADVLFLRGYLRGVVGEFPKGLVDLKRALGLYERLGLQVEQRTTLSGVAGLYTRMGALDEARQYYEDVLRSMPTDKPARERIVALYNLGRNLERSGRLAEAERQFEQSLGLARELHFERGQVYALRGLAGVRNAKDDGAGALRLADEARRLFGRIPDESLRAQLLVERGAALRRLRRAPEALSILREAIGIFHRSEALAEEARARDELAGSLADLGEWRQAYDEQAQARQIVQDLLRRQIDNRFATMKVLFDTEAKERENEALQTLNQAHMLRLAEQRRAGTLQIVAVVLAFLLTAVVAAVAWRQRQAGRQMRALAMTDELTGLPNRRQAMQALLQRVDAHGGGALLILDIDHFKRINDEHGHPAGDEVLRSVAAAWRRLELRGVMLGRLGGEEFIAVLPQDRLPAVLEVAEAMRRAVSSLDVSSWLGGRQVTVSIGATLLQPTDSLGAPLARADAALYRAKSNGRDRVEAA